MKEYHFTPNGEQKAQSSKNGDTESLDLLKKKQEWFEQQRAEREIA